jgi:small subunit ribosomal protein S18
MAAPNRPARPASGAPQRRRFTRRKGCRFCGDKTLKIDYKEIRTLRYFISERGKIVPRRISGNCAEHQRKVTEAINRARNIALLPFTAGHSID